MLINISYIAEMNGTSLIGVVQLISKAYKEYQVGGGAKGIRVDTGP
jgi:hypothetical protein